MMRLNSGLAVGLVELLKSGMAERLDHLLSITLRFTDVKIIAEDISRVRKSGAGAAAPSFVIGLGPRAPSFSRV
jgi:hypothetical protein